MSNLVTVGDVILPDGRKVHAVERWIDDPDTNGSDTLSLEIDWENGDPLTPDEYNSIVKPGCYLHEYVGEKLGKTGVTEYDDGDWL